MTYENILREISLKENVSVEEIEREMQTAINAAGLDCTAKEFIEITSFFVNERRYIV